MTSEKSYDTAQRLDGHVASHVFIQRATGPLTLTSSLQTVPGLNVSLDVGEYVIRGQLLINPTVSGGTLGYQINSGGGLAISNGRVAWTELLSSNGVQAEFFAGIDAGSGWNSVAIGSGLANRVSHFDAWYVVSTAGTLGLQMKVSSGSATVVQYGTYIEVIPLT